MKREQSYPKTKRLQNWSRWVTVTEKLDGSNLVIKKFENKVYYCQRNIVFTYEDVLSGEINRGNAYGGLLGYVDKFHEWYEEHMPNSTAVCGEWLNSGHIDYDEFSSRFVAFGSAEVLNKGVVGEVCYNLVDVCGVYGDAPEDIYDLVPVVREMRKFPTVAKLDKMYDKYCKGKPRPVEGFVVDYMGTVQKYVRHKSGRPTEHRTKNRVRDRLPR